MRYIWMFGIIGLVVSCLCWANRSDASQGRPFTIRDGIELSHFSKVGQAQDTNGVALQLEFSPDRRYFAVVTSRGILATNSVESTIWAFSTADTQAYLRSGRPAPKPTLAARVAVVPDHDSGWSYAPVIGRFHWRRDSKGVLYEAYDRTAQRRLYAADLGGAGT